MTFSWNEILTGIVSASVYGVIFALLQVCYSACIYILRILLKSAKAIFFYSNGIFDTSMIKVSDRAVDDFKDGEIISAFRVIFYTVGFCVASYLGFDGEVRLYNLLISICCFFITKLLVGSGALRILTLTLTFMLRLFIPLLRFVFYPIRAIFLCICKKMVKNGFFSKHIRAFCHNLTLDKQG